MINNVLLDNEKILWGDRPSKGPFLLGHILTGIFSLLFISLFIVVGYITGSIIFILFPLGFFLIILFGVVIIPIIEVSKIKYYITNKRIIKESGIIGTDFTHINFENIQYINVNVGVADKLFGSNTGTLTISPSMFKQGSNPNYPKMLQNITEPYKVYKYLQGIVNPSKD